MTVGSCTVRTAAALLLASIAVTGCTAVTVIKDDPRGFLEIDCVPDDAEITVDGEPMGVVVGWRHGIVPLKAGRHQVEIARDGYFPYRFDVDIAPGRTMKLELDLIRHIEDLDDLEHEPAPRQSQKSDS